jgi:hypothetical protein
MRGFVIITKAKFRHFWWQLKWWINGQILRVVDVYLERRGEERAMIVPEFEELDVLYEYDKLPVMYRDFEFDIALANGPVDVV